MDEGSAANELQMKDEVNENVKRESIEWYLHPPHLKNKAFKSNHRPSHRPLRHQHHDDLSEVEDTGLD